MKADTLIELQNCNIHYFKLRKKGLLSTGPCSFIHIGPMLRFSTKNALLRIPSQSIMVRIEETNYITYINPLKQGGVHTISMPVFDPLNEKLAILIQEHFELIEQRTLHPQNQLKKKLLQDCAIGSGEIGTTSDDSLRRIGQSIGGIFGGISNIFDFDRFNKSSSEIYQKVLGEGVISKWDFFKGKCAEINDAFTDAIEPVTSKCKQIGNEIGDNLDKSENSFIKNVRDYSKKTQNALNEGYNKEGGPRRNSCIIVNEPEEVRYVTFNIPDNRTQSKDSSLYGV